jgi:hypothetical protein
VGGAGLAEDLARRRSLCSSASRLDPDPAWLWMSSRDGRRPPLPLPRRRGRD